MSSVIIAGDTSGTVTLQAPTAAGSTVINLPSTLGNTGTSSFATTDSSGNLGLGVTPQTWSDGFKGIQIGARFSSMSEGTVADLYLNAYYNSGYKYIANGYATQYRQQDGKHIFYNAASGTAGNAISFTQAMTLDASGNLGLGTTSPTSYGSSYAVFEVAGSTSGVINVKTGSTLVGQISNGTNIFKLDAVGASTSLGFFTNTTERARIDTSGNLLVGKTTAADGTVGAVVQPTGRLAGAMAQSTSGFDTLTVYSTTAAAYRFYVTLDGKINCTSTTIAGISDVRFKENIRDLDTGLDAIMALKPRKFDWKEGVGKNVKDDRGFIAQEFEEVFPDLIGQWKDEPPEGEEPYKTVSPDLIPVLVKAIQEQQALITQLQADVAALKGA